MKILITAGGTSEPIDEVRKITNSATGRLGALIADEFAERPGTELIYVCGGTAVCPASAARIIRVGSAGDLLKTLERLLTEETVDAVVHGMAVSDYTPAGVTSAEALAASIAAALFPDGKTAALPEGAADRIRAVLAQCGCAGGGKIDSQTDGLMLRLEKTPKVIGRIKSLRPETVLVGFKLLAGAEEDELRRVGHALLTRNRCDFVLANDVRKITPNGHEGLLLRPDRSFVRLKTKKEIARAITRAVWEKLGEAT